MAEYSSPAKVRAHCRPGPHKASSISNPSDCSSQTGLSNPPPNPRKKKHSSFDDNDYQLPFRFTGTIAKLTYKLGPEQLAESDRKVMQQALAKAHD
jgi:hypothetical protein